MKASVITMVLFILFLSSVFGQESYYPPTNEHEWETLDPADLGWNVDALDALIYWQGESDSNAFLILKDGKIVVEEYYGDFDRESFWYWASAGKTVTGLLIGALEQQGLIDINEPSSTYLGEGWTSTTPEQEEEITVWHQLTMTTGLEYEVENLNCTLPECLLFREPAGEQWYYHNAPYTLLTHVIEAITEQNINVTVNNILGEIPGFQGAFLPGVMEFNRVFVSRARDMARFGIFIKRGAQWDGIPPVVSETYYNDMLTNTQDINPSYGYLWWLNSGESFIPPEFPNSINRQLIPNAPPEVISALGLNSQVLQIIPSQNVIIVRLGNDPGSLFNYIEEMWDYLNLVFETDTGTNPEKPTTFKLEQNYPNPFNPSTVIRFSLSEPTDLNLEVYTIDGRLVSTLANGFHNKGQHSIQFDATGLASGVYLYRLRTNSHVLTRKMMLLN